MSSSDIDLRNLIPSKDAILQHTKRAIYQSGFLWREAVLDCEITDPLEWRWTKGKNGKYQQFRNLGPNVGQTSYEKRKH